MGHEATPGTRQLEAETLQLFEVRLRESIQPLVPGCSELEPNQPMVVGVAHALDEASRVGPVHQSDRTVVAQEEVVGNLADGRSPGVGVAADGQQQLVLRRRQARLLGLLLAPAQEPAQPRPERQQILVIGIRQTHRLTIASWNDRLVDRRNDERNESIPGTAPHRP